MFLLEKNIYDLIEKVKEVGLWNFTKEIIVINDGSTHNTLYIFKKTKEIIQKNNKIIF